ncbi:MAG: histidinol dehydrogenase [Legionella sp.]|nr:histidinol dehydrogenase [Legionella sp.]
MLSVLNWEYLTPAEKNQILMRPKSNTSVSNQVMSIINQVRMGGDDALYSLTQQFDGAQLATLQIPEYKIQQATIKSNAMNAINKAIKTITTYHQELLPENKTIQTATGITITNTYKPIQKVGLYVPGGNNTPLISSLLMQAIPAKVAGCPVKVLCTPPDEQGEINPHLLVAARLCGIKTIYSLGGAQAIAAMAYGTPSIMKVDKLFGPGNSYVTEAKNQVARDPHGAAIDMPAGPSEVMITADQNANPAFIAADLLAQSEHGIDSQVILLCDTLELAEAVNAQLHIQMRCLLRKNLIEQSLTHGAILVCPELSEQIRIINTYAPEHLIVNRNNGASLVDKIQAVGTIFLGAWAAETMGDYITGSNHVLPTHGYARNHSGLGTVDFLTRFSVQSIDSQGIKSLGPAAITLAQLEGLDAHANAVQIRLNALEV